MTALPPGSVIGILGGGQLGRMTALAAARLGYRTHVFAPERDGPAAQVSTRATAAAWRDEDALEAFAKDADVVTCEFENVPPEALAFLERRKPVRPGSRLFAIARHRAREKAFAEANGAAVAPWRRVRDRAGAERAAAGPVGLPAVLKTCEFGYDGKGQAIVGRIEDLDLDAARAVLAAGDAILEKYILFEKEVSVIVARGLDGAVAAWPAGENRHEDGILRTTVAPARIAPETAAGARRVAVGLAEAADLVGLLAVEMFLDRDGRLLVNETAPRPHNSGHWTQDGAATCQFEQLVRAVAGLPLGSPALLRSTAMENLIGEDFARRPEILAEPGARLHLYGKAEVRPGRKMGHVNRPLRDPSGGDGGGAKP